MTETFGARLRAAMDARGPFCVGIDAHPGLLQDWGLTDDARGLERFARTVVEALAGDVAAVKPQSAFFERHGSAGIAVLERTIAAARAAGALVVLDVKRGDIGSTVQAYADAYVDRRSPLWADAVTAHPFLGFGSLTPLLDTALANDSGVFVLAATSNPEGPEVQQAATTDGSTVAARMLAQVAACNVGARPLGSIGAVVGATVAEPPDALDINGPLLALGIGAQGARPADLPRVFGAQLKNVLPAVSRQVLGAGPDPVSLRTAARGLRDAVRAVVTAHPATSR